MPRRPINIRILIPVWGKSYLDAFLKMGLRSLIFPGNIPFLAQSDCNVTVVFLTTSESIPLIQNEGIFAALSHYCAVEYVTIEDLLSSKSLYGIVLTLAFARGITATGLAMTETYFILYNADFILADGGFKTILGMIHSGASIIPATSFRADAGEIEAELEQILAKGPISPRKLASLALKHRHHTVSTRIVNQDIYTNPHFNQIYWQVDEQTLLARYYLATQFCFRPSVYKNSISSFHDYDMSEAFCPDGKIAAVDDSDSFFLLELQDFHQEIYFLKIGKTRAKDAANSISRWTTTMHRRQAAYETVIHGGELPASLETEKGKFHGFMEEVTGRLSVGTVDAKYHHHWLGALDVYLPRKMDNDLKAPENQPFTGLDFPLVRIDSALAKKISSWPLWLAASFLGIPPRAFPWHPLWCNFRALERKLRENIAPGQEYLFVTDRFVYDGIVMQYGKPQKIFVGDLRSDHLDKICGDKQYPLCVMALETDNLDIQRLVRNASRNLCDEMNVIIFFGRSHIRPASRRHFMDVYYHALKEMKHYSPRLTHIGNLLGVTLTGRQVGAFYRLYRMRKNSIWYLLHIFSYACVSFFNNMFCAFRSKKASSYGVTGVIAEFSLKKEIGRERSK